MDPTNIDSHLSLPSAKVKEFSGAFKFRNILITGASGIVGLHFVKLFKDLKNLGHPLRVTSISRNSSIPFVVGLADFDHLTVDLSDIRSMCCLDARGKFDLIVHAAGYGQPAKFMADGIRTIALNSTLTMQLHGHLAEGGTFLNFSTSEVYSGLVGSDLREGQIGTTNPFHPRAAYIESKRLSETIVDLYRSRGCRGMSLRLALAYGPGVSLNDNRVINELIIRGLRDGVVTLKDDGSAIRTYLFVQDAMNMFINIAISGKRPIYNIGGRSVLSIRQLAIMIADKLGVEAKIPYISDQGHHVSAPSVVSLSMDNYFSEFPDFCHVPIERGLDRTIAWYRSIMK